MMAIPIVIDSCVLPKVFKASDKNHKDFAKVCEWIIHGDGKLVYGGTKQIKEISEDQLWFVKFLGLSVWNCFCKRV